MDIKYTCYIRRTNKYVEEERSCGAEQFIQEWRVHKVCI